MNIYGAIIGDVVGSVYEVLEHNAPNKKRPAEERKKILDSKTPLFTKKCSFTDDSILTTAIAHAVLKQENYERYLRGYGLKETKNGTQTNRFGVSFVSWLNGFGGKSFGNGASMRVSAIGYAFDSLSKTLTQAEKATICSHSHHEAIDCAKAVAGCIFLARTGKSKQDIKRFAESLQNGLDLDSLSTLTTANLTKELLKIHGVGKKVADCITFFGFNRTDSFPVDTWIEKIYLENLGGTKKSREVISNELSLKYGELSGFIQQYLFYYKRTIEKTAF